MWNYQNNNQFYRRSYRSAPPKMMPAIIACQFSTCLIIFGLFFLIAGCMARFVAGDDSPPKPPFDDEFFVKSQREFAKTPRMIGMVLLIISSVMIGIALIGFITSCVLYRNFERDRRVEMVSTSEPNTYANPDMYNPQQLGAMATHWPAPASAASVPPANYPPQPGFQYPPSYPGYTPVSQNMVYNPTTEPHQPYIAS